MSPLACHGSRPSPSWQSIGQTLGALPLEQLSTRQLVLWSVACYEHNPTREDHALLRTLLEGRVAAEPHYADALVALAHLYCAEYAHDFNPRPDPLGRAPRIARRVIALEPSHYQGWEVLAIASFYSRDEDTFRHATERALQLNPRDSNTLAWTGNLLVHAGDYDRGAAQTARAMSLNPHHPGWYHFAAFNRHVSRREFVDALRAARRIGLPEFHWCQFATATAAGHLGRHADAGEAVRALERLAPDWLDQTQLRHWVSRWYWEEDLIDHIMSGIDKARRLAH